jgi:predicted nucleic-acid-binding protein
MLAQVQVPIGQSFPVQLVLLSDGSLVFVRVAKVGYLLDQDNEGNTVAVFTDENFTIGNEELWYNTIYRYKEKPGMLDWLKNQNLVLPPMR